MKTVKYLLLMSAISVLLGGCSLLKMNETTFGAEKPEQKQPSRYISSAPVQDQETKIMAMPDEKSDNSEKQIVSAQNENAEQIKLEKTAKKDIKNTKEINQKKKRKNKKKTFEELAPTTKMNFKELVADNGVYEFPKGHPKAGTYRIVVDLTYCVIMVYRQDANGKYTIPVRYMLCSPGKSGKNTPTGTFKMGNHRVRFGLFVNTKSYAQYWTQITGRIYFHSVLYTDRNSSSYSESAWNELGSGASSGCIRLPVPDARWIWFYASHGTEVEIKYGSKNDKETAQIREQLILAKLPEKRIEIPAGSVKNTDTWEIEDVPVEVKFKQGTAAYYSMQHNTPTPTPVLAPMVIKSEIVKPSKKEKPKVTEEAKPTKKEKPKATEEAEPTKEEKPEVTEEVDSTKEEKPEVTEEVDSTKEEKPKVTEEAYPAEDNK